MKTMSHAALSAMLILTLMLSGCALPATDPAGALPEPVDELDEGLVSANTAFALDLLGELRRDHPGEDLFFSPASVSLALAMTYNGADGETFDAMARTLRLGEMSLDRVNRGFADLLTILKNPDPELELSIANSIWARQGMPFKEEFLKTNQEYYGAETRELDFDDPGAPDIINSWVEEATRGRIEDMLDDIRPDSIMFLINAIYFGGSWTEEFDPEMTREDDFHRTNDRVRVPFMNREGDYPYHDGDGFKAVAIPYGQERLSMYILLPDEGEDVDGLIDGMNSESWDGVVEGLSPTKVNLSIPRFTVEFEASLADPLRNLGMAVAFDEADADFSGMYPITASENVFIQDVKHKAFVTVDESGTEAAAATSVEIGVTSMPQMTTFRADSPFVFAIADSATSSILFLGIVNGSGF